MTEFAGIEAFVHTAEQRSFRRAAQRLGVSPAAISKAVARLEERLGVQLLERTSRRVRPTAAGEAYLLHGRRALDALQAGHDAVALERDVPDGPLRISVPFILGARVVPLLPPLAARHPRLRFDVSFTDRYVHILDERVDVAVRIGPLSDSSVVARRLRSPRWCTVASPRYLGRGEPPRRPADLAAHRCLKFSTPSGTVAPWIFAAGHRDEGTVFDTPTHDRCDQGERLVDAAVAGLGIAQAFDFLVEAHLAEGRLVELLPHRAALGPPVHALIRPSRQHAPEVRVFMDALVDAFG